MREILYFQAGKLANYVGAHFWNAQEQYFTYGEDAEESIVDHDISFREGLNFKGEQTFCPRLLLFDRKSNFGAVPDLYGESDAGIDPNDLLWNGPTVEYRQEAISTSDYHAKLEAEAQKTKDEANNSNANEHANVDESRIRYWSDYSRVFFHHRSMHRLPDVPEWEDVEGDWKKSSETFEKYDEEHDFMDDAFRVFVEECDNLQGIQVMSDSAEFGSFTNAFLTRFRDDFTKLPCLTFPFLSTLATASEVEDDPRSVKRILNDALVLRDLSELSTTIVPLQPPSSWKGSSWTKELNMSCDSMFQTSAVLATHIESVTLPARLRRSTLDFSAMDAMLNWRTNTRFVYLNGVFPLSSPVNIERDVERRLYDLSAPPAADKTKCTIYARMDVSRGFSSSDKLSYWNHAEHLHPPPYGSHSPTISLPTSFPNIFKHNTTPKTLNAFSSVPKTLNASSSAPKTLTAFSSVPKTLNAFSSAPKTLNTFSSLETTPRTAQLFRSYAAVVGNCLGRHVDVVQRMGIEMDDVRELREGLWALEDAYKDEGAEDGLDEATMGEDEDFD